MCQLCSGEERSLTDTGLLKVNIDISKLSLSQKRNNKQGQGHPASLIITLAIWYHEAGYQLVLLTGGILSGNERVHVIYNYKKHHPKHDWST